MIKRLLYTIPAAVFIFMHGVPALCDVASKYWEFSKPVLVTDSSKKAAAIPLDDQVYNASKPDLTDLRVLDAGGSECPYALFTQREIKKDERQPSAVIAKDTTPTDSIITVEMKGTPGAYDRVLIVPEGNNFIRKITIEGSDDRKAWNIIRKDSLIYSFAFQTASHYFAQYTNEAYEGYGFGKYSEEKLSVLFPEVRYKFVRVTVPHDQDKEPVALKDLEIFSTKSTAGEEGIFRGKIISKVPGEDPKTIDTIVDLGSKNLGISSVNITAGRSNYFRRVEIYGSDDLKEWKSAGSGVIFSIAVDQENEENSDIDVLGTGYRYLKIKVFNGDNKPIDINDVTAKALTRFIIIMPEAGAKYRLIYGNPSAKPASYDIGDLIRGKTIDSFARGALGSQVRNDNYVPYKEAKPWTEERPYILWIAMMAIIIGLIFLASRIIRSMDIKK